MYSQIKLINGIRLLVMPIKSTKAITVLVLLPVGSRYETKALNGVSHFIEHMMFKGTKRRPSSLAVAKELDRIGAEYNAFTGQDTTGYWIKTISEKIEVGFDVLSDMLFNSLFDQHEFEQEKGVILEEIKMYQENPLLYIDDFFHQIFYGQHPLGRLITGPIETIKKLKRVNLLNYKEKFYQPDQMIIAVAGNINKAGAIRLVKKYFSPYQNKRIKNKYVSFKKTKSLLGHRVGILFKEIEQTQIALGGFAYPYNHRDLEPLLLLLIILGGNMSSRLFTEVRVKRGLVYFIKADASIYQDIGNYVIRAGVDKDKALETLKVILNEIKKIKEKVVTNEELARAKDYFQGTMKLSLEDSANIAGWHAKQLLLTNQIISPQEKLRRVRKVNQQDIQRVVNYLFVKQGLKLALIGPFKNKKPFLRVLKKGV